MVAIVPIADPACLVPQTGDKTFTWENAGIDQKHAIQSISMTIYKMIMTNNELLRYMLRDSFVCNDLFPRISKVLDDS